MLVARDKRITARTIRDLQEAGIKRILVPADFLVGRMLGETDAKHAIVQTVNEIAHILTGRSEIKARKKAGLGNLIDRLKLKKK